MIPKIKPTIATGFSQSLLSRLLLLLMVALMIFVGAQGICYLYQSQKILDGSAWLEHK